MKIIIKIIFKIFQILFAIIKDIYKTTLLSKCEIFDIMEIIGIGLLVNALYTVFSTGANANIIYLFVVSLYGTLKARYFKKEKKC